MSEGAVGEMEAVEAGRARLEAGDAEGAAEDLQAAAEEALGRGDIAAEASARGLLVQALILLGRDLEARIHAYRGVSIAREVGDPEGVSFFEGLLARIAAGEEEDDEDDAEDEGDDDGGATEGRRGPRSPGEEALDGALARGQGAFLGGRLEDAQGALEEAVALARAAETPGALGGALAFLAQTHLALGALKAGRDAAAEARDIAAHVGDDDAEAFLAQLAEVPDEAHALGAIQEARGALEDRDLTRVLLLLRPVAPAMAERSAWELEASARGLLAQALARLGRREAALPEARRAFEIAKVKGNRQALARFRELVDAIPRGDVPTLPEGALPFSHRVAAAADVAQGGDLQGALDAVRGIATEAMGEGARSSEATARHVEGQLLLALDRDREAGVALRRGLELARILTDEAAVASFEALLGEGS